MSPVGSSLGRTLSSNVPRVRSCGKVGAEPWGSAPASALTAPQCSRNLRRSDCRHPKCHCSWNTIKCFCSCCRPLKIRAASMTAVEISQALPFTCQQGLKIVQAASADHCRLLPCSLCIGHARQKPLTFGQYLTVAFLVGNLYLYLIESTS